ncbi:MAG TPA: riboflavin synthase, partial [Bacteroidales bacterium]|nr:riboflavin synthase [Bacteroidales bacterium]
TITASPDLLKYIVHKGSIAIDGVSLTVAYVDDSSVRVSIIPHTKDVTTLLRKKPGSEVNLECDMIGKYIEKFIEARTKGPVKKDIDMSFLSENGFA